MLVFDPNLRINANEAFRHTYFNEYRQRYQFSSLNQVTTSQRPTSATNSNIIMEATNASTTTQFFDRSQNSSVGHDILGNGLSISSASLLTSFSSENQSNGSTSTGSCQSTRSLPMTQ